MDGLEADYLVHHSASYVPTNCFRTAGSSEVQLVVQAPDIRRVPGRRSARTDLHKCYATQKLIEEVLRAGISREKIFQIGISFVSVLAL